MQSHPDSHSSWPHGQLNDSHMPPGDTDLYSGLGNRNSFSQAVLSDFMPAHLNTIDVSFFVDPLLGQGQNEKQARH